MAAGGSKLVVVAALGFNAAIAVAKFAAAAYTGSSAMLSEAVHSVADTSNQALLLYGLARADRPADARHPFGYSKELYFWSFVVAILLFSLGAGVSIYEGIEKLNHPRPITNAYVNYIVLAVAIVLEAGSTYFAVREFNIQRRGAGIVRTLRSSKDPALFTVLLEDCAALAGLVMAFLGIMAADIGGMPEADGIASLTIGLLLAAVAAFIAVEVKGLLIGEAASEALVEGVRARLAAESRASGLVRGIGAVKTMQLGASDVLVAVSIDVDDEARASDIEAITARLDRAVKRDFPDVRNFYVDVRAAGAAVLGETPETPGSTPSPEPGQKSPPASNVAETVAEARPPRRKRGKGKRRR